MRIAITGATGFLGGTTARQALAAGWEVTALGRDPPSGRRLNAAGARFLAADILDQNTLTKAFEGADAVAHCAGLSSPWGTPASFNRANIEGTRSVASAVHDAGVAKLVHISSTSVYFRFRDQLNIREDHPFPAPVNAYAASKQQAEAVIRESGVPYIILRPRGIFGAGDTAILPRLIKAAARRPLPLLRGGLAEVDLTYAANVADAILLAACHATQGHTFNISNGEPVTIRNLVDRLMSGLNIPHRWQPMPASAAIAAARLLEVINICRPGQPEPTVTAYSMGLFAYSQTLDITAARKILNWHPAISLDDALEQTIELYVKERAP